MTSPPGSLWFRRFLLPGMAFKAVVIGGGYATGRELATFFLPSGPRGGLLAMMLAMGLWSLICAVTFLFAQETNSHDYRTFFRKLLGPLWPVFEVAYALCMIVVLAVMAAAAGAIGAALFGWPTLAGELALVSAVAAVATFGNDAVEQLFKYVSFFLYATYAIFLVLALTKFGDRIGWGLASPAPMTGWIGGGITYAAYNVLGAVIILPVTRHLTNRKDALIAGALAGPLAMAPAILFFLAMIAFYPRIEGVTLPADFLLERMNAPIFRLVFQAMIFSALFESSTGMVHALNERIAATVRERSGIEFARSARLAVTVVLLLGSAFAAERIGLVALIAHGYVLLAYLILGVFVLPLMTIVPWRLLRSSPTTLEVVGAPAADA